MPPSPIIKATLNPVAWARLCTELQLDPAPTVRLRTAGNVVNGERFYGHISFGHDPVIITIFLCMDEYDTNQLRFVAGEISRTLLHEARHAWQWATRGEEWIRKDARLPYAQRLQEIDAEDFAAKRIHEYRGLVRVLRSFPSSPMSRLSKTQANVLRNV